MRTAAERHTSLDKAMAGYHVATRKLFSETPAFELVIWLNEQGDEYAQIRRDVLMLVSLAATADPELTPAAMTIMRLAEWSHRECQDRQRV